MDEKQNISQYREKLDKTLMSHDLSNMESLRTLVESQMSKSTQNADQEINDNLVQRRTKEVVNIVGMLRSASGNTVEGSKANETPHGGWKIKHDNEDCRVMYREGPAGTFLHTLLVEGYVDGPLDVCMCITWEAGLYPKWLPQFNIPTFKITFSECVKKIRMGEQISLVSSAYVEERMKFSWPLSTREALVHFVSLDYFQEDLIIVLMNTIPETENIDKSTHGFTRDGIPSVENVTRIDVVGGVAMQKVSAKRSYFRTIANMDIKLDFVPPTIINFVSRQIIGSGFKLYKKKVASVAKGDADFSSVLKEPFYGHIREALYTENKLSNRLLEEKEIDIVDGVLEQKEIKIVDGVLEQKEIKNDDVVLEQETVKVGQPDEHCTTKKEEYDPRPVSEIEEVEETGRSHENNDDDENSNNNNIRNGLFVDGKKEIIISSEVNQALGTLETVISVFREIGFSPRSLSVSRFVNNVFTDLEENKSNDHKHVVNELTRTGSQESRNSLLGHSSRHKVHKVVLAENNDTNGELIKNIDESSLTKKKIKKQRFCCLSFASGQLNS